MLERSFVIMTAIVFMILAYRSGRTLPHFGITSALPIAAMLGGLMSSVATRVRPPLRFPIYALISRDEKLSFSGMAGYLTVLILFTICFALNGRLPFTSGLHYGPDPRIMPVETIQRLSRIAEREEQQFVIAATPDFGGTITWYGSPNIRALIDDRNTLLGERFYKDFLTALTPPVKLGFFKDLGATHLLTASETLVNGKAVRTFSLSEIDR